MVVFSLPRAASFVSNVAVRLFGACVCSTECLLDLRPPNIINIKGIATDLWAEFADFSSGFEGQIVTWRRWRNYCQ